MGCEVDDGCWRNTNRQGTLLGDVDGVQGGIVELQLGEFSHVLGPSSTAPILNIKEARSLIWAVLCRSTRKIKDQQDFHKKHVFNCNIKTNTVSGTYFVQNRLFKDGNNCQVQINHNTSI
jgi:hypothetical protein